MSWLFRAAWAGSAGVELRNSLVRVRNTRALVRTARSFSKRGSVGYDSLQYAGSGYSYSKAAVSLTSVLVAGWCVV